MSILLEQAPMAGPGLARRPSGFRSAEQRLDPAAIVEAPAGGFDGQMRLAISVLLDAGLVAETVAEREPAPVAYEVAPVTLFGIESDRRAS
ncbi:hypothetical protein [Fodinicola feengrottensis]|uniref:hypothetical protein n=1 Tax=Fodinicola feengrottensis TaxID=435914 RepID=UPI0031D28F7C